MSALCFARSRRWAHMVWTTRSPFLRRRTTMADPPKIGFASFDRLRGVLVVFCAEGLKFGPATHKALSAVNGQVRRAAAADRFTGKNGSSLDIIAPPGLDVPRLVVVGTGKPSALTPRDLTKLGGIAMGKLSKAAAAATIF